MTKNPAKQRGHGREWVVALSIVGTMLGAALSFGQPPQGGGGPQAPYVMPPLGDALFSDLHNKIIHFPIVLGLLGALLVLVAWRKPQYETIAFWVVWFALLSTLAAYFSGLAQSTEFLHRPKRWIMETHMRFGIGLAFAECVWLLALLRRRTHGLAAVMSFIVAGLVLVTGFLGGLVAHGRGGAPPPAASSSKAPAASAPVAGADSLPHGP
jgi:uncharacterized membrane protein